MPRVGMDITSPPCHAAFPCGSPSATQFISSLVNFNCPHPSDAHFNRLSRLPQDAAHEEGEMILS